MTDCDEDLKIASVQISALAFDIDCMKKEKEITDIRLNGFEKWLEDQAIYPDVLDVFKKMVRNEFKGEK